MVCADVAQIVERGTENAQVTRASRVVGTVDRYCCGWYDHSRTIKRHTKVQVVALWHLYYKTQLSDKDRRRLDQAVKVAENSECRMKHGAVLTAGGRVLSVGINTNRNDPAIIGDAQLNYSVHAEVAALRAWGGTNLKNATIYVARISKSGDPVMSKPCSNCQKTLKAAGVKKVVYTVDNEMEI